MLTIGRLKINGDVKWPKSRAAMKKELRAFAKELGLNLRFASKKVGTSSCQITTARASVCEGVGGKPWRMDEIIFHALHEIAHWIQFNEGMFKKYFGTLYYDAWVPPKMKDLERLNLRAERHADSLARKMSVELFGYYLLNGSIYDKQEEAAAKAFFKEHYGA